MLALSLVAVRNPCPRRTFPVDGNVFERTAIVPSTAPDIEI
jgi:hypothetical protein